MNGNWLAIVFWVAVACGVIASMIAISKGRSRWGYFFAGFFFGVFGILAAVLAPRVVKWPPGWYADPADARYERYWDGRAFVSGPRPRAFA